MQFIEIPTGGEMNRSGSAVRSSRIFGEQGATVVEFALVVPLLLLLLMAIFEFGVLFWVNMTMQHAVREGARYAITGRTDLDPDSDEDGVKVRPEAVLEKIRLSSLGLYDSVVDGYTVTDPDKNELTGFGGPGQIVVINLQCSWPLLTPLLRPFFENGNCRQYRRTGSRLPPDRQRHSAVDPLMGCMSCFQAGGSIEQAF
jgi:hypothetical protein